MYVIVFFYSHVYIIYIILYGWKGGERPTTFRHIYISNKNWQVLLEC